ncbi:MAG: hypothetical protein AABX16_03535 [Nanoarchaeota archaeon]
MFSIVGVFALNQGVHLNVQDTIEFTLQTTNLSYGSVVSGGTSDVKDTLIQIGDENNVNIKLSINLDESSNNIFGNIWYNLNDVAPEQFESQLSKTTPIIKDLPDPTGSNVQDITLQSVLKVPVGTTPANNLLGTVIFTATANPPE